MKERATVMPDGSHTDRRRARVRLLLVVLACVALILGYTWPLPLQATDHLILTYAVDLWPNLWNFGWVRTALADLHQSPYYTYSVFYPTGVPLTYHALNVFSAAVSIPAQVLFGVIPAFNLLLWGNLIAAVLATYWLARGLGLPAGPAFLAGLVFACGPTINSALNQGQGEQYSVFWLPLYAGLLIRGGGLRARGRPPGRRGYLVAGVLAVLALGPTLIVGGHVTGIPLPYAAILELPGAAAMRAPVRFLVFLTLCTALLAAYGLAGLGAWRRPGRARIAGAALVAVLELPDEIWGVAAMFHEALHHHPILGGYLSRHPAYWFTVDAPGVAQLVQANPVDLLGDILTPAPGDVALQALDYYGVRTVVVHPLAGFGRARALEATLHLIFPGPGVPQGNLTVYSVPSVPQTRAFLILGEGWYALEPAAAGGRQRWTAQAVGLPPADTIRLVLDLRPGEHLLTLASVQPATHPPGDRRLLSLGYRALRLERTP